MVDSLKKLGFEVTVDLIRSKNVIEPSRLSVKAVKSPRRRRNYTLAIPVRLRGS